MHLLSPTHSTHGRFRFDPPAIEPSAELRFALCAAFGPAEALERAVATTGLDPKRAATLAGQLRLDARIGARHAIERLARVLDREAALELWQAAAATARQSQRLRETAQAASTALGTSVPHAFLKSVALDTAGHTAPGAREAADVDVLVPADRSDEALQALCERGFSVVPDHLPPAPHQLPTLLAPTGSKLEVHLHIPGLRLGPGRRDAEYRDLALRQLLVRAPQLGPEAHIPTDAVLAAHAVVHALAQHGMSPQGYPLLRVVGDLIDLGLAEDRSGIAASVQVLVRGVLSAAEWEGSVTLTRRLACGDASLSDAASLSSPEGLLLRHMVAGATDPRYGESLKWRAEFLDLDGRYRSGFLAASAWRLLAGKLSRGLRRATDTVRAARPGGAVRARQ
jgi:hypothetical protein